MKELFYIISYGLCYFALLVVAIIVFLGALCLLKMLVEFLATVIPGCLLLMAIPALVLVGLISVR